MYHTSSESAKWIPPLCLSADADSLLQQGPAQQLGKLLGFCLAALSAACLLKIHTYAVKEDMLSHLSSPSEGEASQGEEAQHETGSSTEEQCPAHEQQAYQAVTANPRIRLGAARRDPDALPTLRPFRLPGLSPQDIFQIGADSSAGSTGLSSFRSVESMTDPAMDMNVMELQREIRAAMEKLQSLESRLCSVEKGSVSGNEDEAVSGSASLSDHEAAGYYSLGGRESEVKSEPAMAGWEGRLEGSREEAGPVASKSPRSVENRSEASTICSVQTDGQPDSLFLDGIPMHQSLRHCQDAEDFFLVHNPSSREIPQEEEERDANSVQTFFQTIMSKSFSRELHF
ncbi:hypothetical protein GUITHDRAFT_101491 [Guillardia theta CCMP2712]|uniref:Uncharacterized protein n=1 Tax=Guillardia theta (strain CCMP2712) TaxID=905079 RepID=L1JWT2_GUITC|nr:hypothetical protein GUITHDRAFT_101491 [Guillardia theta CCMP2712]EKX53046.1 hypothetical protein GUITHDRAFT_101491 [Guillardia theta CCMP2712]|mmetsp:Transcript_51134/g.159746  ORF Transcript_51134/g.159746 Transcript_51134/m.159746 type:complete len:343 (-) Transcript_51134:2051-3079(-)|eukprot:XP_005840026.1 hypothetical protein GUITHDRAFT_101491 [Guillardia theta CCMP2712]